MNKWRQKIELAGLKFKNEVIVLVIINFVFLTLGILAYIFLKTPLALSFVILTGVLLDYVYLSRYKSLLKNKEEALNLELVDLLTFFHAYLKNGYSVYQALKELLNYASRELAQRINYLLEEIDGDKSVAPFVNFARKFTSAQFEQLFISIYQMIDEGNNSAYLNQFEIIFSKLRDETFLTQLEKKEKSLSSMSAFPLVGSALLIVMITFGILTLVEEMINGL